MSSRQSSLKNSKIESKKDVIIIDDSIRSRLKITRVQQRKTFGTLSNLKYTKNGYNYSSCETNDITNNTKSFENYKKIPDTIKSKLPNCKYAISNIIIRKDKPDIEKKVIQ